MTRAPAHRKPATAWRVVAVLLGLAMSAGAEENDLTVTLAMRDVELSEVMGMISRAERVNILLADDVSATVSFSLYDVPLTAAIESITLSCGRRCGGRVIPGRAFRTAPFRIASLRSMRARARLEGRPHVRRKNLS